MEKTVYEYAGILGVNPDPYSLRQLFYMVRGKCAESWDHTAAILSLMINQNRGKHDKAITANELNPYRQKEAKKALVKLNKKDSMSMLKSVFIDHKNVNINKIINKNK